jgi:Mn2+/Fe2+ NRAMP family transporter
MSALNFLSLVIIMYIDVILILNVYRLINSVPGEGYEMKKKVVKAVVTTVFLFYVFQIMVEVIFLC